MKFWLASSDLKLIESATATGLFAGVITNPRVVAEAKRNPLDLFRDICQLAAAAYYQLNAGPADAMLAEARKFLAIAPGKMRIKVPATREGFGVIAALAREGHEVMATCVPTQSWMVLTLAAGARVIAPYGSMLQKRGIATKADEVVAMQQIINAQDSPAEICVGIYDVTEIAFYARHGIRQAFIWGKDVDAFLRQPLVDEAVAQFAGDWKNIAGY